MVFFCPTCANLLLIGHQVELGNHLICQTCSYKCTIDKKIKKTHELKPKRVDEIRGGKAEWEAVPKTQGMQSTLIRQKNMLFTAHVPLQLCVKLADTEKHTLKQDKCDLWMNQKLLHLDVVIVQIFGFLIDKKFCAKQCAQIENTVFKYAIG